MQRTSHARVLNLDSVGTLVSHWYKDICLLDTHVFLRRIFGADSRLWLQYGNNDACQTWKAVRRSVVRSARNVLTKLLPRRVAELQASSFNSTLLRFYSTLPACAKRCWWAQHITPPWNIWEQKIRDVKEKRRQTSVSEGRDKNMGKSAATCRVGMLERVLHDIADPLQFEVLQVAPLAQGARTLALAHLHQNASLHGLPKHWQSGARK